jgi:hypothetical protein
VGDVGDNWREHRDFKRTAQRGQYRCECGCYIWKRRPKCGYCDRPNPHKPVQNAHRQHTMEPNSGR